MGMSTHLPPTEMQGLRPVGWRGLREALEHTEKDDTFSTLSWGMSTAVFSYPPDAYC
jgi:hypothetical protein